MTQDMITRVRRWHRDRCAHCGHRFAWQRDARHSFGNRDGNIYHEPCIGYLMWRTKAEERLDMLNLVCEVWTVSDSDVKQLVELRAGTDDERVARSNLAFRVFYDLEKQAKQKREV